LWDDGSLLAIADLRSLDGLRKKKERQRQSRERSQLQMKHERKKKEKRTGVTCGWSTGVAIDDLTGD
jgi:hypothetical protein